MAKKGANYIIVQLRHMGISLPKFLSDPAKYVAKIVGEKVGGQVGKVVARGIDKRKKMQ